MRTLKAFLIFTSFIVFLAVASLGYILTIPLNSSYRDSLMSLLSCCLIRFLRKILGIKVYLKGAKQTLKEKGNFIIARHIGYIDGLILGGLFPSILLSKKDIKRWPLIGQVVTISGTVFVDRSDKNKVGDPLERMKTLLRNKINVIVFPEGTSTNGDHIKSFQTVFFQVPIVTQAAIVPVSISYLTLDKKKVDRTNCENICWYGQISFFKHLWNFLRFHSLEVEVAIHHKIPTQNYQDNSQDRKRLSQLCHQRICDAARVGPLFPRFQVHEAQGVLASPEKDPLHG